METPLLGGAFRSVLVLQGAVVVLVALAALMVGGHVASGSVMIGGGAVFAGSLAYAFVARPAKVVAVSGKRVLLRHMLAEVAKICISLGLVFAAFATQSFEGGWLLVGMGVALFAHRFAFLRSR